MEIQYDRLLTTPTPFNTLLWRILVMTPDGYLEGYYSLVSGGSQPRFMQRASDPAVLAAIADAAPVKRLRWFTRGFCEVSIIGSEVVITDLRMGSEPNYVFRFAVAEAGNGTMQPVQPRRLRLPAFNVDQFAWVWHRIWSASLDNTRFDTEGT